jgi:hypothetical protein
MRLKIKTSDEKRGNPKMQGAQNKDIQRKKRQPQNARGSKERPLMKKRGNSKMQGAQNKDLRRKKEPTSKCKGLKTKTFDENRGNHQHARG